MAILQFAFGKDPQAPDFKPHNYPHHLVAYTGTHDNDTVVGWWTSTAGAGSIRTAEDVAEEMEYARRYLNTDGREINWVMIRSLVGIGRRHRAVSVAGCAGRRQRRQDEPARHLVWKLALALSSGRSDTGHVPAPEAVGRNLRTVGHAQNALSKS